MTAWVYVLAICNLSKSIGFNHLVVMATDESNAYAEGSAAAHRAGLLPVTADHFVNDYVIQLVQP